MTRARIGGAVSNDRVTCWLWYGEAIVCSVRVAAGASDDDARMAARFSHLRNPTIYADFPAVSPYEQERRIARAEVRRYEEGR